MYHAGRAHRPSARRVRNGASCERGRRASIARFSAQEAPIGFLGHFRRLTSVQRNTFIACFLGWSLDAFDFFILIFCVTAIADHFHMKVSTVLEANFLTLAMRPVG